jgi:anti-anti-sigma regulatory factor
MKHLARCLTGKTEKKTSKPVIIDCIGPLTLDFAVTFEAALAGVELTSPVLVQCKRATLSDTQGLSAMAETVGRRRGSGGYAAFVSPSNRWREILQRSGIASDWILNSEDASAKRSIILAHAAPKAAL